MQQKEEKKLTLTEWNSYFWAGRLFCSFFFFIDTIQMISCRQEVVGRSVPED